MGTLALFSEVLRDFEHVHRRGRRAEKDGARGFEASSVAGQGQLPRTANLPAAFRPR
jgi:hypothetical protein